MHMCQAKQLRELDDKQHPFSLNCVSVKPLFNLKIEHTYVYIHHQVVISFLKRRFILRLFKFLLLEPFEIKHVRSLSSSIIIDFISCIEIYKKKPFNVVFNATYVESLIQCSILLKVFFINKLYRNSNDSKGC